MALNSLLPNESFRLSFASKLHLLALGPPIDAQGNTKCVFRMIDATEIDSYGADIPLQAITLKNPLQFGAITLTTKGLSPEEHSELQMLLEAGLYEYELITHIHQQPYPLIEAQRSQPNKIKDFSDLKDFFSRGSAFAKRANEAFIRSRNCMFQDKYYPDYTGENWVFAHRLSPPEVGDRILLRDCKDFEIKITIGPETNIFDPNIRGIDSMGPINDPSMKGLNILNVIACLEDLNNVIAIMRARRDPSITHPPELPFTASFGGNQHEAYAPEATFSAV